MDIENPQAFPSMYEKVIGSRLEENERTLLFSKTGMTLRDYFAGQVLSEIYKDEGHDYTCMANIAYEVADAMLLTRTKDNRKQ